MATTPQTLDLIRDSIYGDHWHFQKVAEKIAQNLKKRGHNREAQEIEAWLSDQSLPDSVERLNEINGHLSFEKPTVGFADLILPDKIMNQLKEVVKERQNKDKLAQYGLENTKNILLLGNPGTGKTFTAYALAHELNLPLREVKFTDYIDSRMGNTGKAIKYIFDSVMSQQPGVYFFDEFDALASRRSGQGESADKEYNEIVNTILKGFDHLQSNSFIIAATNMTALLDPAIQRRFDLVLKYPDTNKQTAKAMIEKKLNKLAPDYHPSAKTIEMAAKLSLADVEKACNEAMKRKIIDSATINDNLLQEMISNRLTA